MHTRTIKILHHHDNTDDDMSSQAVEQKSKLHLRAGNKGGTERLSQEGKLGIKERGKK